MTVNQATMTGPNSFPMTPVPARWIAKSPQRMAREIGITRWDILWVRTSSPSTAPSTVMAGVMMPSP